MTGASQFVRGQAATALVARAVAWLLVLAVLWAGGRSAGAVPPEAAAAAGTTAAYGNAAAAGNSAVAGSGLPGVDEARFRQDLERLTAYPSRVVGSEGHRRAEAFLREQLTDLVRANPGRVELREHSFDVLAPVTRSATVTLRAAGSAGEGPGHEVPVGGETVSEWQVFPVWPAAVRLSTTPTEGIRGRIVYSGEARGEEIIPAHVAGNIAAVEATSHERWSNAFYFGARAVLILGSDDTTGGDLRHHELFIPVNLPRFYVPPGELADRIRAGTLDGEVVLRSDVRWERVRATNFYLLVMPQAPGPPEGWPTRNPPGALVMSAAYDATSLVPDLGPGAGQAAQVAALLDFMRESIARGVSRPVLGAFLGADGLSFQASRQMLMALADPPSTWTIPLREVEARIELLGRHAARLREIRQNPPSLSITLDSEVVDRVIKLIETDQTLQQDMLFRLRLREPELLTEADRAELARMEARQIRLSSLRGGFLRNPHVLAGDMAADADFYIAQAIERIEGEPNATETSVNGVSGEGLLRWAQRRRDELRHRIDLHRWLGGRLGIAVHEGERPPRANNARVLEMQVAFDITGSALRVGPMSQGRFQDVSNINQILNYRDWFSRLERDFEDGVRGRDVGADEAARQRIERARWFGDIRGVIDFEPLSGARSFASWMTVHQALATEMSVAWGVPSFTWSTLDDMRLLRDSPNDRLDRLHVPEILRQYRAVRELMLRAWADVGFRGPVENPFHHAGFEGQVVSLAPGRPVPDLPREGFLVASYYTHTLGSRTPGIAWPMFSVVGQRRNEIRETDAEGNYFYEALPRMGFNERQQFLVLVYQLADDGSIIATSDFGRQAGDIRPYADIRSEVIKLRSVPFKCAEVTLVGLFDPRFLLDLGDAVVLDARRNAVPQRFSRLIFRQMMSGFIEPDVRSFFLFRFGRVGNRLMLLNMDEQPPPGAHAAGGDIAVAAARGLTREAIDNIGPLNISTARDFFRLNTLRIEGYRDAGVSSALLDDLQTLTAEQLEQAIAAVAAGGIPPAAAEAEPGGLGAADFGAGPAGVALAGAMPTLPDGAVGVAARVAGAPGAADAPTEADAPGVAEVPGVAAVAGEVAVRPATAAEINRLANGAWANQTRVYAAASEMANDVIRAAIFLLLLCVPFAFCMERLLIGSPNVYKQIGGILGIFGIMMLALWSFHPAFQISSSPLIIVLAFAIISMSCVVIFVVYSKFDSELKRIRSGRGSAEGASIARASVLMSAVLLGIANMRKRKFRTALTAITIVLITFAVLAFTSSSRLLDTTTLATGEPTRYPGLLLRQRGFRPMPVAVLENLRGALGERQFVERWWNVNAHDPREQIHVTAPSGSDREPVRLFAASAALGLSPGESSVSRVAEVIGPENFAALEAGERDIVYLPSGAAERLGVGQGDHVFIGGMRLRVAGVFNAERFDRETVMLSGEPLTPLRYTQGALDASGRGLADMAPESLDLDATTGAAELQTVYEHLSASQIVIVPARLSRMLPNGSLRNVTLRLSDQAEVTAVGDDIARRFALAIFAGYDDGVRMLAAGNLTSVSGAGQVAIPLMIAGLIIFNTMMGSIAERKREIHVYTSLGLAPMHVGALFVAEAMTYGLIGAVFGYVMGQGVGTLLMHLGWLGGVTLNYSGTSAMMTLGLILVVVLLSALVPARLASKIAAPSIERNWRVPLPKGDQITADLPFTINKTAAMGAVAYLWEFFDAHREGSIGKFSSGKVEVFTIPDERGRESRGIKTVVWLTPFDLGVRQHLMLLIHPGQFEDIYEVQVVLQRLSGDDSSWYRMNRTFLTELRRQFLQWRSLTPQRMLEYVEQSRKLHDLPVEKVVETVPGDVVRLG